MLMAFKNLVDMSSRNLYDFSYEQKAVVCLRFVYPLLFDRDQHCFLLHKSKEEMCNFHFAGLDFSSQNV